MSQMKFNRSFLGGNTGSMIWAVLAILTAGCGKTEAPESMPKRAKTLIDAHTHLSGSAPSSATSLNGSQTVVFDSPLSGVTSKSSFALTFVLNEGGSLALNSNGNSRLGGAIGVVFSRVGKTLSVKLKEGGAETNVSAAFASLDASETLSFLVDVHNDEVPAHILIWSGSTSAYTEDAALMNSEDPGFNPPGNGSGQFWGLALSNATVSQAQVGGAKFVE